MSRPKAIGTAAETAVVRAARAHGFPDAERIALRGRADAGDVRLTRSVVVQVKGGEMARNATDRQIALWVAQAQRQAVAGGARLGILVCVRRGVGPANAARWHAFTTVAQIRALPAIWDHDHASPIVRIAWADMCALLVDAGLGG